MIACDNGESESDAYGQFEAYETKVSAQANGQLIAWNVRDGQQLRKGEYIGQVDSTKLHLQRAELQAQLEQITAQRNQLRSEVEVLETQLGIAQREVKRVQALVKDSAATQKQLDEVQDQVRVFNKRIAAAQTGQQSLEAQKKTVRAKREQLEEQIDQTRIIAPIDGTVLNNYAEQGEVVRFGQPVLEMASLDTLELRVFISGAQLPHIQIGQTVTVLIDENEEENQTTSGVIRWISDQAEFTPQAIQTKEERVTQVYAVKVAVPNPKGQLKIGMPGEMRLK
jgi:HlyD family secretion protein